MTFGENYSNITSEVSFKLISKKKQEEIEMNKYEVWTTIWSEEHGKQIKVVAGEFDRYMNASLFAKAYEAHYSAQVEIVEYTRK